MDGLYLIHRDKEYLKYCLSEIEKICASLGIIISGKKTRIVKLCSGVNFLKGCAAPRAVISGNVSTPIIVYGA